MRNRMPGRGAGENSLARRRSRRKCARVDGRAHYAAGLAYAQWCRLVSAIAILDAVIAGHPELAGELRPCRRIVANVAAVAKERRRRCMDRYRASLGGDVA